MSEFAIRDAELADARAMSEIIAAGREQTYNLTPGSRKYKELVTDWRGDSGERMMRGYMQLNDMWWGLRCMGSYPRARVATRLGDRAISGLVTSREVPVEVDGTRQNGVTLDFIFVNPDTQGKGVGTLLMDDFAASAGPTTPWHLEVRGDNERAQSLYRKYGFVVVGQASSDFSLANSIEMVKPAERQ
jgi:ribosomal protein S18 acetylase RimI-like enzyme